MLKVLIVVLLLALVVYGITRAIERRGIAPTPRKERRTIAPDDDTEFLRDLDWRTQRDRRRPPRQDPRRPDGDDPGDEPQPSA